MKRGVITILVVMGVLLAINFISAAVIDDELHLNIQVLDGSGDVLTGTYNFSFNISTDSACSDVVYANRSELTTDTRGIVSYYLEDVNLNFSSQYWLCYYRDFVLIDASKVARSPYTFTAKNVSAEGVLNDSNMNMVGKNITASSGLFSWLGSLLNRVTKLWVQDIDFSGSITGIDWTNITGSGITNNLNWINHTYNATYDNYVNANFSNKSNYWVTSEGHLNNVVDVLGSWITNNLNWLNRTQSNLLFNQTDLIEVVNASFLSANTSTNQRIDSVNSSFLSENTSLHNRVNSVNASFLLANDTLTTINTTANIQNLLNGTNMEFADVDFNDGWLNNGVSIIGGEIYAQTLWVYNLSSLNINSLSINGSLLPPVGFDNTFDIGSSSLRWKDLYLSGQVYSNGTGDNWFLGDVGIGTASPTQKLEVAGNVNITGNISMGDAFMFTDASGNMIFRI